MVVTDLNLREKSIEELLTILNETKGNLDINPVKKFVHRTLIQRLPQGKYLDYGMRSEQYYIVDRHGARVM